MFERPIANVSPVRRPPSQNYPTHLVHESGYRGYTYVFFATKINRCASNSTFVMRPSNASQTQR